MSKCFSFRCIESGELYVEHVVAALTVWEELKPYYRRGVERVLGVECDSMCFDPIAVAIALHDVGKLTKAYYEQVKGFRHELFSAYATYSVLESALRSTEAKDRVKSDVAYLLATAVMLHHEPIIMRTYVGAYGERYLTISNLKRVVEKYDLSPAPCDVKKSLDYISRLPVKKEHAGECLTKAFEEFYVEWSNIDTQNGKDKVFDVLKRIIAWASVMGDPDELLVRRARVASILHLIVVADSVAAHVLRTERCGSSELRDEANYIVERVSRGAEPLDMNQIRQSIMNAIMKATKSNTVCLKQAGEGREGCYEKGSDSHASS
ncbi:CRISPR-associated endonuclease Cas3'' [Infirmifilum sp.]|uniref:CRISPR-associated endonuclease Cas3'' n=1 Tax=Infirmifilum sp. TaxID=2856575 RepID=UPI003D0B21B7